MIATFKTKDNISSTFEHPVIIPNTMQHSDGFILLGFLDWEAVNDEKFCAAVTNVTEFHIQPSNNKVGF